MTADALSLMEQFLSWYKEGKIHPIRPITIFDAKDVTEGFKYMQSGKHMGKIVVKMPTDLTGAPASPIKKPIRLSASKSYLLAGGLGGIGRAVSTWLVENGAKHLIFLSRSAGQHSDHHMFSQELQQQGCSTDMVTGNVANLDDVNLALSKADGRLIGGVIHLSMVLQVSTS